MDVEKHPETVVKMETNLLRIFPLGIKNLLPVEKRYTGLIPNEINEIKNGILETKRTESKCNVVKFIVLSIREFTFVLLPKFY